MNMSEEYFWKANMAFQTNRLNESSLFISQAIEQLNQSKLTLEQLDFIWAVILKIIENSNNSIERLVFYHRSMPIETDELFDRLTKIYVNQLEEDQANICIKFLDYCDRYLIQENPIHLKRLQSDLYLQLSSVSRPYQSRLYYNKHIQKSLTR